jgi:NAD(P)-dependent dehydrogenase (short-subunit alcohol dehydrogenase family)
MPTEFRDLTDTVVAATGANSGIGAATARLLLDAGPEDLAHAIATVRGQSRRMRTTQWQLRSTGQSS